MMFSPRWRKVLRDLLQYKTRTALVVLSIAVGVFAVGMISDSQKVLSGGLTTAYLASNPPNATLTTEPFDDELVQTVRGMKEVRDADGRRTFTVRLAAGSGEWRDLSLTAVPDYRTMRIGQVTSQSGAWPPPEHELLLERASASYLQAKEGDLLQIKLPNGKERMVRVAGLAYDVSLPPPMFAGTSFGYVSVDSLEWLGQTPDFNELQILVAGDAYDKNHVNEVSNLVRNRVEKSGRTVSSMLIPEPGKHMWDDSVLQGIMVLLGTLGAVSLLLSGFLVTNTISALLAQQIRQIGVMKSVGARSSQIMGLYLGMVSIYGLLALVVGVPLGVLGANLFSAYMVTLLNFDLKPFGVTPQTLAIETAVGLLVPLLASVFPVVFGTRITVREALSSYGIPKGRVAGGIVDRLIDRMAGSFSKLSRPLLLSLRNTFRRKGRLILTLATLILAGAIFVAVLSVRSSSVATLSDTQDYFNYDISVDLSQPYRIGQIEQEALAVPGVVKVESWGVGALRRIRPDGGESGAIYMFAIPAQTGFVKPTLLQGRWLLPEDGNAVVINTDILKDDSDIEVGDDIVFKEGDKETTWHVVGIVRGVLSGPTSYANYAYYARTMGSAGRAATIVIETERHDAAFQSEVAKAVEARFDQAGLRIRAKRTISEIRSMMQSQFDMIIVMLAIMAVLLAVVGGLGLMGTMSMNVLERTREIGIMRAIGASDGAILRVFLVEGILIGFISWAVGAVLALPLSMLMNQAVGIAFTRAPLSYAFSTEGMVLWLAIVIVLSSISSFLPSWNASRLKVREVLAYE